MPIRWQPQTNGITIATCTDCNQPIAETWPGENKTQILQRSGQELVRVGNYIIARRVIETEGCPNRPDNCPPT